MPRKEKVTRIIDRDTIRTGSRKNSIRLANVNAPEKNQRGGKSATEALRKMVAGKTISVETVARDKYGRSVANIKVGNKSVNKAMNNKLKK